MNVKCAFCQNLYTLSRETKLAVLQDMTLDNQTHFDAHCPRCRRATRIERSKLEHSLPNWQEAMKDFEQKAEAQAKHSAELEAMQTAAKAEAEAKQLALIAERAAKAEEQKREKEKEDKKKAEAKVKKPAAKKTVEKKPAAKKPAAKAKKKA
jgi:hypothetical protein